MSSCPECHGTGVILLFTSVDPCKSCGGTEGLDSGPALGESRPEDSDLWINTSATNETLMFTDVGNGSGGTLILTGGTSTGTSTGGSITLTAGNSVFTTNLDCAAHPAFKEGTQCFTGTISTATTSAFSISSAQGPQVSMLTGTTHPNDSGVFAEPGSLYFRDDAGDGTVWVKTSEKEGSWCRLAAHGDATNCTVSPTSDGQNALRWAIQTFKDMEIARAKHCEENDDDPYRTTFEYEPILAWIPAIAPVCSGVLADAMSFLEQRGHEVEAFVTSSRDFADIRKFEPGGHIVWDGKEVSVYGIPVRSSNKIPMGYMGAVSTERQMAIINITR